MENMTIIVSCKMAVNYFTTMYMMWRFLNVMMERKRPAYVYWLFFGVRFFVYTLPSMDIFRQVLKQKGIWEQVNAIDKSFWMLASIFLIYYFWKGDFLKSMFGTIFGEVMLVPITGLGVVITNLIAGDNELMAYTTAYVTPAHFIVPVVYVFLFLGLLKIITPWLSRYRDWEIKPRALAWCFVLIYTCSQYVALIKLAMFSYIGPILIGTISFLCLTFGIVMYQKNLRSERAYLLQTQKMLEVQYREIQTQIQTIERMRPKMEAYIDEIGKSQAGTDSEQLVSDYLGELKGKYQTLHAGTYSDDPMIDAVLSYYAVVCKEEQIPFEVSTWNYRRKEVDSEETKRRLSQELERAVQKNKKLPKDQRGLRVILGTVKGQVILKVEETWNM